MNMPRVQNISVLHRVPSKTANHIPQFLNMLGLEYMNMSRLRRVLCKLFFKDSPYLECLSSEYPKVLNVSGV